MKKFAMLAVVPLFAGYLCAQTESEGATKTWTGTLVDATCYTTPHAPANDADRSQSDNACTVTRATTSFGVAPASGEFMAFDQPSNDRVLDMIRKQNRWHEFITEKKPIPVRVIGVPNGNVIVIREIE
jgi:hypothetical protein